MKLFTFSSALLVVFAIPFTCSSTLEEVTDDELLNLIKTEKYVVTLFTKKDCSECEAIETELVSLREDLVDALNGWVVKAKNSNLVKLYNPNKEPALVFFRHGIPLLYDGPINDELILHTFRENKEPSVRELTDGTFEHLTQAASGATTGDWLVQFYSTDCVDCQRMTARWEAVGAALKTRMNVARINKAETGSITSRRFAVYQVPTIILFRQGKMYRYNYPKYDVKSFVHFATEGFLKVGKSEVVPVPKSPFDDLTQMIADYIQENSLWLAIAGGLSVIAGLFLSVMNRNQESTTKKSKKSKDKQKGESKKEKSKKSE